MPPRARARAAYRPISFRTAAGRCAIVRCRFAAVRAFLMFRVLFAIQVFRASGQNIEGLDTRIEIGAWLALTGSVIVLIAGFLSTPEQVVYET